MVYTTSSSEILRRIQEALQKAVSAISPFIPAAMKVDFKLGDDPVTEADRIANEVLRDVLLRDGEGWLSEESADDLTRLKKTRVWVVDPIDGTREFVAGIPEWCISIGLIENSQAIAGGICNPATGETFLGSLGSGMTYNGSKACASRKKTVNGATVLASRSEVKRGDWERFRNGSFTIQPMGSVAYKLARVAAGLADATWTLCPKHEWDIAAGVALVNAAGGFAQELDNPLLRFNNRLCILPNLLAGGPCLAAELSSYLQHFNDATETIVMSPSNANSEG
jgi:myo-inositol-1(or 4)-monophosphatase